MVLSPELWQLQEVVNDNGEQNVKKFRLPSLSRPSIYHEVQFDQKLLSHYLCAWKFIDVVGRNKLLVSFGSERIK